jgi:formate/nitrite transporter FocA (FNT family)
MFIMPFTTFQRKTTLWDWAKNWTITYLFNMAGCLFVAGFLAWWSDTLSEDAQKAYAVTQAESRVNQQWSVNFLRGVGCNLFVSVSLLAIEAAALMSPESPSQS